MALEEEGVKLIAEGSNAFGADMKAATKAVDGFGVETKKAADLIQDAAGRWRTSTGRFATDAEKAAQGIEVIAPAAKKAGDGYCVVTKGGVTGVFYLFPRGIGAPGIVVVWEP